MFYQTLLELCEKSRIKPSTLMKELGFSTGNIKRWENGSTVNSDILITLSQYFDVSVDYLLLGANNERQTQAQLSKDEIKALNYYQRLDEENKDYIKGEMVKLYTEQKEQAVLSAQKLASQKEIAT